MSTPTTNDQTPILVPLDGSELAERALPVAGRLARAWRRPLLHGSVDEQITELAAREGDLIIMGTHGHSDINRLAFGSVASKVLHGAKKCPCCWCIRSRTRKMLAGTDQ